MAIFSLPPRGVRWPRHTLHVLTALGCSQLAQAAEAQAPEASLPVIAVTATREAGASMGKTGASLKETPQSLSIISQERMQEQNLQTLDDVLQQATGTTVQPFQLLTTAYYARGFKIDSFEQDGVPVLMGNMASPQQDMAMLERVEILRGANGLLHGSGNPAATVNLVAKRPQKIFAAQGALSTGSWERRRGEADIGGPLNATATLRARVVATHEERDYFYDVAQQNSSNLYGVAELDLAPGSTLSFGAQKQRIRSVTNMAGVPRYADGGDIGLPRSTYLDAAWDQFDWDTQRLFASLEQHFANGWQAKVQANHLSGDSFLKYAGAYGAARRDRHPSSSVMGAAYRFENGQNSVDAYASGPFRLGGRQHELLLGANVQHTSSEQFSASFLPPPKGTHDVFHWNPYALAEPATSAYASRGPTKVSQWGAYAMGRFQVSDALTAIAGTRLSRWKQETRTARVEPDTQLTPYGGLVYALSPQWSGYSSYTQVFQPQSQTTFDGKTLDPVTGNNLEAGIKGALANGKLDVSLAVYQIRQNKRAQEDPNFPCAGNVCYYIAGGEVQSRGLEAEANGQLTPDLNLSAGYSYNTTRYLKDAESQGQPFASFAPAHILRAWANATLPWAGRRLSAGLGVQAQSHYSVTSGGVTLRQGGYALANARLGWRIDRHFTAALNLNNLFDKHYYQSLSGTAWNNRYGEPRSVMLSLRAQY
jgi:outer membrane receptor for ferric coprogen and ferric-rhodotorulic acid